MGQSTGSTIYIIKSNSKIFDSDFLNSSCGVSALLFQDCLQSAIMNSNFTNICGPYFGPVSMINSDTEGRGNISGCRFINNTSRCYGGGLSVIKNSLLIADSVFFNNSALCDGGAIYYDYTSCQFCSFAINGTSRIEENSARFEGGGIKFIVTKPYIGANVSIVNNSAQYGDNFASVAKSIEPIDDNFTFDLGVFKILGDFVPGQLFEKTIKIAIKDDYDQIISTMNNENLKLDDANENPDFSVSGNTLFYSNRGIFEVSGFYPIGYPSSKYKFKAYSSTLSLPPTFVSKSSPLNTLIFSLELTNCSNGEQILKNACIKCENSTYLIEPSNQCKDCPTGGICPGGDQIYLKPDYYRSHFLSEKVYYCDKPGVCLGNSESYQTVCLEGYTGIKCQVCDVYYTKVDSYNCAKCYEKNTNFVIICSVGFAAFIFFVIFVNTAVKSAYFPKSKHSIYLKIFSNYLQLNNLISDFKFLWPDLITEFFQAQNSISLGSKLFASIDCYFYNEGVLDSDYIYYTKLIILMALPFFIFFISFVFCLMISFFKENYIYLKREFILTLSIIFLFFHPYISKSALSQFDCETFDFIGSFIRGNLEIKCDTQKYKFYSLAVALPGVIIWSFGIPSILLLMLFKFKANLKKENYRVVFGYLYNGYLPKVFYWEIIIIYRKLIIISIQIFLETSSDLNKCTALCRVLVISLNLQLKVNPYSSSELNKMESFCLSTVATTSFAGIFFFSGDISYETEFIFFLIIVIFNASFVSYWAYWILKRFYGILVANISFLSWLRRTDAFDEEFYIEEIHRAGITRIKDSSDQFCSFLQDSNFIAQPESEKFSIDDIASLYISVIKTESI